jgi:amino acid transporter
MVATACSKTSVCVYVYVYVYIYIYIYISRHNRKQQSLPTDLSKMVKVRSVCSSKYFLIINAANGLWSIYEFNVSIFVLNYYKVSVKNRSSSEILI